MAFIEADYAFDQTKLDFNAVFRVPHQNSTFLPDPFSLVGASVQVGTVKLNLPPNTINFTSGVFAQANTGLLNEGVVGDNFVYNSQGLIATGTAKGAFQHSHETGYDFLMVGFSISAADVNAAALTADRGDELGLVAQILAGNDLFVLSNARDRVTSGAGKDLIYAQGGNDRVSSGDGADLVLAGAGADTVLGGLGADILLGGAGSDQIFGGGGNDTIVGGAGNDTLVGDGGADRFVFATGAGQDHIRGFAVGTDKIAIQSGAADFAALAITQDGSDTVIRFGTVKITLDGIDDATITASSFQFASGLPHAGVAEAAAQQWLVGWDYMA